MSILYIVSTPIGNLGDITFRAIDILKNVDFILCEDTRRTQKLLNHYNIKTPTISYHQHSKIKKVEYIINLLKQSKNLALVSDAGTPGISDPGNKLINLVLQRCSRTKIVPIPGPSALIAAASIADFPMNRFIFLGFLPHKKKRKKILQQIIQLKYPVIFYESPYRILKTLQDLLTILNKSGDKIPITRLVVCRELTKKFESIYRGTIEEVINQLKHNKIKGEFVVIVGKSLFR